VNEDQLLDVAAVSALLRCSKAMVWQLLARGEIESLTIGSARRIRSSRVHAYIEARGAVEAQRRAAAARQEPETAREVGSNADAQHSD
jgi:excisionase family DNA binding protein